MHGGAFSIHFSLMLDDIDIYGQLNRWHAFLYLNDWHVARIAKQFPRFTAFWACTSTTDLHQKLIVIDCHIRERVAMVILTIHNWFAFFWYHRLYHIQMLENVHYKFPIFATINHRVKLMDCTTFVDIRAHALEFIRAMTAKRKAMKLDTHGYVRWFSL